MYADPSFLQCLDADINIDDAEAEVPNGSGGDEEAEGRDASGSPLTGLAWRGREGLGCIEQVRTKERVWKALLASVSLSIVILLQAFRHCFSDLNIDNGLSSTYRYVKRLLIYCFIQ